MYFCTQERLESNLTYASMCGNIVPLIIIPVFYNKQKTDVTIMVMCDKVDIIAICFVFYKGSLSCQMMCFRKALSLVAQVKIRDVPVPDCRLFF